MIKLIRAATFLAATLSPTASTYAQTLTATLTQESPDKLARDARQNGNIVRGAILFHQGNINCISCHRPSAETDRIGPNLGRMDASASDAYVVESILRPSKEIKKGYETISVLTADGEVSTGMLVRDDEERVVIRSTGSVAKLVEIPRGEIQQIKPSNKSNMPEGLVDVLSGRQQFLDLLRYVLDLRDRGNAPANAVASVERSRSRQLDDALKGLVLINKMNCVACHASAAIDDALPARRGPDLKWSASHLSPAYLVDFIANPQQVKPGTTMPHMLSQRDASKRKDAAESLVHYLVSLGGSQLGKIDREEFDDASSQEGFELFHSVGCVACHAPRNMASEENAMPDSMPLGELSSKYNRIAMAEFLKNPHAARPQGRMPNMQLTHREALHLAAYLLPEQPKPLVDAWAVNATLAKKGKRLFAELDCVACHTTMNAMTDPKKERRAGRQEPMESLDWNRGCLSGTSGNWPTFELSDLDLRFIRTALRNIPTELTPDQRIDMNLSAFNCTACHSRDGLGGVSVERSPHFQTTNLNLGEQGRIPPTLSGVGAKLRPEWMRDVLVNARTIRPYMKTRMPQYGEENVGHLIALFQDADTLAPIEFADIDDQKEMRTLGLEIAGNEGLNCAACHTFQYKLSDTMPAVDLTEMAERLKKQWFYYYMLAPQKFSPNTVMPSFWPGGKAMRPDIKGQPNYQIEALWQYLLDGRQARPPKGVVREPLEIVVTNEARMLRRKYPGMGKRGIGIGYPGGVNLAFDAEQMRLSQLWRGRFVDPSGVWYGQGHGTVRLLGKAVNFPVGPDIDDLSEPWIADDGRPPNHKFKGYELDDRRRPILGYDFENVTVRDYFQEHTDKDTGQVHVRRSVELYSPEERDNLRLRVAAAETISALPDGSYSVGQELRVRIESKVSPKIVSNENGMELVVPISVIAEQPLEITVEYQW